MPKYPLLWISPGKSDTGVITLLLQLCNEENGSVALPAPVSRPDTVVIVGMEHNWLSSLKAAVKNAPDVKGVVLVDPLLPPPDRVLPQEDIMAGVRVCPFMYTCNRP